MNLKISLVFFLLGFLTVEANKAAEGSMKDRMRMAQENPRGFFNGMIEHWITQIPKLMDDAVDKTEAGLKVTIAKKYSQGTYTY